MDGDALAADALPDESADRMDRLCGAGQDLLRVTAALWARPAIRPESTMATFQPADRHLRATEEPDEPVPEAEV